MLVNRFETVSKAKKTFEKTKNQEKKSLDEIISNNNYYDFSKKHSKRRASVDIVPLFEQADKTENILLGKKVKLDFDAQNLGYSATEKKVERKLSVDSFN